MLKPVIVVVACIVPSLLPVFVKDPYFLHIAIMTMLNILLSVSLFPLLRCGLFSIAHGAFMGIGAYCSAIMVMRAGLNFWVSLPLSGLASALVAVLIGIPVLRIKGLFFLLITFSFNEVVRLILNSWSSVTGGPGGISEIPYPTPLNIVGLVTLNFRSKSGAYYLVLVLTALCVLAVYRLWHSRIGRIWKATESADILAESLGIDTLRYRILVFAISTFFAGIAGSFYAHYYRFLSPVAFEVWQSIYPLVYLQVGGLGSIVGPVIGSIVLTAIPETFRFVAVYQPMIFGGFIILVMLVFPNGLIEILEIFYIRVIHRTL